MMKPWLTIKEVCALFPIKSTSLYEKCLNTGAVKAVRFGNRTLVESASLVTYFASLPPYRQETNCEKTEVKTANQQ